MSAASFGQFVSRERLGKLLRADLDLSKEVTGLADAPRSAQCADLNAALGSHLGGEDIQVILSPDNAELVATAILRASKGR